MMLPALLLVCAVGRIMSGRYVQFMLSCRLPPCTLELNKANHGQCKPFMPGPTPLLKTPMLPTKPWHTDFCYSLLCYIELGASFGCYTCNHGLNPGDLMP
eukprot:7268846-Karenia_brevis.AAC.1